MSDIPTIRMNRSDVLFLNGYQIFIPTLKNDNSDLFNFWEEVWLICRPFAFCKAKTAEILKMTLQGFRNAG